MARRKEFPAVPLGALGFTTETPTAPPSTSSAPIATTRGVGGKREAVLGGWPVYRQVRRVLLASIDEGRDAVLRAEESLRCSRLWGRFEGVADETLKETISYQVLPIVQEDEDGYDRRLDDVVQASRLRIDEPARSHLVVTPPAPRAHVRQVSDKQPSPLEGLQLPPRPAGKASWRQLMRWADEVESTMTKARGEEHGAGT